MGIREIDIAGKKLIIYELEDVCDSVTGHALTGSWVWDSALVLSRWMVAVAHGTLGFEFEGKIVLELGAGTGIPGLTAALLGASRVILTDIGQLLPSLMKNVEANGLGDRVEVSQLVWGSEELPSQLGEVDLVLMSDLFYDETEMAALGETLQRVCREKNPQTVVWAASELRPWTGDCLQKLVTKGFEILELPIQLGDDQSSAELPCSTWDVFSVYLLIPPCKDNQGM